MQSLREQFRKITRDQNSKSIDGSSTYSQAVLSDWTTTNQDFFDVKELPKHSKTIKRNFKQRTPFTHWSNAYFGNGVFFNPPVRGI
jgi:hypothetical protein